MDRRQMAACNYPSGQGGSCLPRAFDLMRRSAGAIHAMLDESAFFSQRKLAPLPRRGSRSG
jgi:hypothetical protein